LPATIPVEAENAEVGALTILSGMPKPKDINQVLSNFITQFAITHTDMAHIAWCKLFK